MLVKKHHFEHKICESDFPISEISVSDTGIYFNHLISESDANFVPICNVYVNHVVINVAISIINYDELSRSYDDLYLGITFLDLG